MCFLARLNRKIFKPLGAQLVRFPPGRKGYNVRVERSHRTDDEEFYLPLLFGIKNGRELLRCCRRLCWIVSRPTRCWALAGNHLLSHYNFEML